MSESLKARIGFRSAIVQSQTVRSLVAAVLKEKGPDGRISSRGGGATEALWEQCCGECAPVRSACCDALVLLVEQGHADLQHIMDTEFMHLICLHSFSRIALLLSSWPFKVQTFTVPEMVKASTTSSFRL